MFILQEKILKSTIQKSDSQKAFSPWWEDLEDKLLHALMIFGKISIFKTLKIRGKNIQNQMNNFL